MAVEFDGDFIVETPREEAFAVLSDADRFSPLLPTYLSHKSGEDGSSDVAVKVGVGKIKGTAVVNLRLVESERPNSAEWAGQGKIMGGAFNLTAGFDLDEIGPSTTRVRWRGGLTIFGKLTSLAGGLIQPVARKQIQQLVDAIRDALGRDGVAPATKPGTTRT
ncbi:MAG TPA: SRPBCC domain-containing protein [Woeseiaceae bacterium]|nr:SRPBCC domain-containing protein [Woeseiaceae bacterium]